MPVKHVVRAENLTVKYGDTKVVDDVNIGAAQGEILGVVGPNGAGKTTIFKAILGAIPYQGRISLFDQAVRLRRHLLPLIGYVPQRVAFEPMFPATVSDVVQMGLTTSKGARRGLEIIRQAGFRRISFSDDGASRSERVARALEAVGMERLARRRIGSLSGGQQQRVFIAQALVHNPLLLILDEPVASMDVKSQREFYAMIREASRNHGITVVMSLHDLDMLREHCNRVCCMNCAMAFHGDTESFFANEEHLRMYTEADMHTHHA